MNRLGDVSGLDLFRAGEVGDGAAGFEDSTVGAGALKPSLLIAVSSNLSASSFTAQ